MQKFKSLQELFEDEKRWTKGWYAADANGNKTAIRSPNACAWCVLGAMILIHWNDNGSLRKRLNSLVGGKLSAWNDNPTRTIDDVRRLVKEAGV